MFERVKEKIRNYLGYLIIFLFLLMAISLIRNILRISQAKGRVETAEERVSQLKEENERLQKELKNIESEAYVEFQAREKLGLAGEGEIIVVLPDEEVLRKIAPKIYKEEETLPDPTWKKWIHLFGF